MSIYWNNILIKRLQKTVNVIDKYRVTTDIGRFYFYFKECKDDDSEKSVKIIFFPKKEISNK
ncbi:MAG: hypothetical protein KGD66_07455 [Candidatus Lokiarchaeota archaeon]|nr:hypothetical protein [Candidatus Lokiarchaeota archaeon]